MASAGHDIRAGALVLRTASVHAGGRARGGRRPGRRRRPAGGRAPAGRRADARRPGQRPAVARGAGRRWGRRGRRDLASPFALEPVSATFHGRDIFAPVAAHLAGGAALAEAGRSSIPAALVSAGAAAAADESTGSWSRTSSTWTASATSSSTWRNRHSRPASRSRWRASVRVVLRTFADADAGELFCTRIRCGGSRSR